MSSTINPNGGYGYGLGGSCCPELGYCEAILLGLQGIGDPNNPSFKAPQTGALQALFAPSNREGAKITPDKGDGHKSSVRIKYLPRRDYTTFNRQPQSCEPGETIQYVEKCLELNDHCRFTFCTTDEEVSRYCSEMSRLVSGQSADVGLIRHHLDLLMATMGNVRNCIDTEILRKLFLKRGYNVGTGNNNITALDGLNADGSVRFTAIQNMISHYRQNNLTGKPLIIGAGNFDKMNTVLNFSCCNDSGIDFGALAASQPYYYYYAGNLTHPDVGLDPDDVALIAPGTVQFLSYNKFRGFASGKRGTSEFGTIADPFVPGLTYDVQLKYDDCEFRTCISLSLNWDIYVLDDDAYLVGDPLRPVDLSSNGINWYNIDQL